MESVIETFEKNWQFVRGLTYDFVECVPEDRWEWSPNPRFAPFHKQVRHMICVHGVYNEGLRNRVTDFGKKHSYYSGELDRESLRLALQEKDSDTKRLLAQIRDAGEEDCVIEFYGPSSLAGYLNVYGTHEAIHQGQWSFYATIGGFESPQSWKFNWGL